MVEITDEQFADEISSESLVLVDCWAPWCAPCKTLTPILEEFSEQYAGKIKIVKINIDENEQVVNRVGIRSVPYLMMFKNGQLMDSVAGALPKQKLKEFIEFYL